MPEKCHESLQSTPENRVRAFGAWHGGIDWDRPDVNFFVDRKNFWMKILVSKAPYGGAFFRQHVATKRFDETAWTLL
jgi:hypothetical protein